MSREALRLWWSCRLASSSCTPLYAEIEQRRLTCCSDREPACIQLTLLSVHSSNQALPRSIKSMLSVSGSPAAGDSGQLWWPLGRRYAVLLVPARSERRQGSELTTIRHLCPTSQTCQSDPITLSCALYDGHMLSSVGLSLLSEQSIELPTTITLTPPFTFLRHTLRPPLSYHRLCLVGCHCAATPTL